MEAAVGEIRTVEEARLGVVTEVAAALGLPRDATITQICNRVDPPWDAVLSDHHAAFLRLVASTEQLSARNRELAQQGLGDARAAVAHLGGAATPRTYGKKGDRSALALPPTLVDQRF